MKYYYVYIIECADESYYTGITNNIERRFNEHKEGNPPNSYTKSRRPLKLVYNESFTDPNQAILWEKKIKGWSHRKKKALIEKDWESLVAFAKSYKTNSE